MSSSRFSAAVGLALLWITAVAAQAAAPELHIVAAENFYGDVAQQLAGPAAQVVSVLNNPDADPHLFEADVGAARAIAGADLLIYNGVGYDLWMTRLLGTGRSATRRVIEVAALLHRQAPDANPHLWYDPATMPVVARALCAQLQQLDPTHAGAYAQRLQQFLDSLRPIDAQIAGLRRRYAGEPVTATEPVADDLTAAIGLTMRNQRFQLAIMNDTEPGARETAAFEQSLRNRTVRVLIYNRQATDSAAQRLLAIAQQSDVPVVGVTETEPAGVHYQQWIHDELDALDRAFARPRS